MTEQKENSKLDTAIGIWKCPYVDLEIEYTVKDFRKLKKIVLKQREDRTELFDDLADYLTESLLPKYHSQHVKDHYADIVSKIETNIMDIFYTVMLDFKFTTKEKMLEAEAQAKKYEEEALKNL